MRRVSHSHHDDVRNAPPRGGTAGDRGVAAIEVALTVLLAAWVVLAAYLFLMPDPEELTESVHPSLGHSVVFMALGATAMARLRPRGAAGVRRLLVAGVAGGIAVEIAQELLTSGRGSQFSDVAADAVGLVLGMGVVGASTRFAPRPTLVTAATAVASTALLLTLTATIAIGPRTVQAWWSCRSHDAPTGTLLLHIAPDDIAVPGDAAAAARLRRQLEPLRASTADDTPGYRFAGGDRAGLDRAPSVVCGLRDAGSFTLVAHLDDLPATQRGPARVLTMSHGTPPASIDLHLAMVDDGISVRLRTTEEDLLQEEIPGLVEPGRPFEVVVAYDGRFLSVTADGRTVHRAAVEADPEAWRFDQPLTIGNEHGGDRGLRATITRLDLYAGVVTGT